MDGACDLGWGIGRDGRVRVHHEVIRADAAKVHSSCADKVGACYGDSGAAGGQPTADVEASDCWSGSGVVGELVGGTGSGSPAEGSDGHVHGPSGLDRSVGNN